MAQEIAPSIKRLDYVKLQSFCTAKDTTNKAHRAHRKGEKSLKAMFQTRANVQNLQRPVKIIYKGKK